jgi:hypothetical protein
VSSGWRGGHVVVHLPGAAGHHGHEGSRSRVARRAIASATPQAPFTWSAAVITTRKVAAPKVIQARRTSTRQGPVPPRQVRGAMSERAAGAPWHGPP